MYLHAAAVLAFLPSLISANDQVPLKDKAGSWLDKAKGYVSNNPPAIPNPIDAGAAVIAGQKVEKITIRNYERKLGPKPDSEEEWMIYIRGGNKTCWGRCDKTDLAWNESVPLLAALEPFSGSRLKLATINCEADEILCTAWAAAVPSIFHFIFPQQAGPGQSQAPSPLHDVPLNMSRVSVDEIVAIPRASKSRYLEYPEYIGAFHPVDGQLVKINMLNNVGWILWGFGSTPSWLLMIAISFFSRQMMARRASARTPGIDQLHRQAAAQPAAAPAPKAAPASPAGARAAAKKRR